MLQKPPQCQHEKKTQHKVATKNTQKQRTQQQVKADISSCCSNSTLALQNFQSKLGDTSLNTRKIARENIQHISINLSIHPTNITTQKQASYSNQQSAIICNTIEY